MLYKKKERHKEGAHMPEAGMGMEARRVLGHVRRQRLDMGAMFKKRRYNFETPEVVGGQGCSDISHYHCRQQFPLQSPPQKRTLLLKIIYRITTAYKTRLKARYLGRGVRGIS